MSLLVIQLPARPRPGARSGSVEPLASLRLPSEWSYVLSSDETSVASTGRAALALLPAADRVVAVLADADCAWHRITLPNAPPARLRAALAGVMEEALLDDEDHLHLALGAGGVSGQPGWVAVVHRPWLQALLTALEARGLSIERVLPASSPVAEGEPMRGHFYSEEATGAAASAEPALALTDMAARAALADVVESSVAAASAASAAPSASGPHLLLSRPDGVTSLRLSGDLARALQPPADVPVRWTTTPAAAAAAEAWLGAPVPLLGGAEFLLEAAAGADNLRQFDLAARHRGSRALRDGWRQLLSPAWRPVRWGLAGLVAVQLMGLNAHAWQERQALDDQRAAMAQLLRDTHPGVRAVLDAPRQMQRETDRLRAAAGRPGDNDLEALMSAAAAAWPDSQGPVQALRFEGGRLSLTAPGWTEDELAAFSQRLQAAGFSAERSDGRIVLGQAPAGVGR
jgi:general secretion pathway protein L